MLCSHVSGSRYERPPAQSLQHLRPHLLFRDTTSSDHLNSRLDLKHPKTDWDFRSQSQGLPHPTGRVVCSILPRRDFEKKKKVQKFLGDQILGSGSRPQLHLLHLKSRLCAHAGTDTPGAVQDGLLEIWPSRVLQLSCVHTWHGLKLVSVLQCLPKNREPDTAGTGEQRPAQERLSRRTKLACTSF